MRYVIGKEAIRNLINEEEFDCCMIRLTPEVAKMFLESNYGEQRLLKQHWIKTYMTNRIDTGKWKATLAPFSFRNGVMLDGQNRCVSIMSTGETVDAVVFVGVDEDNMPYYDTGRNRTVSDMMKIKGVNYYTTAGTAAKHIIWYKGRNRRDSGFSNIIVGNDNVCDFVMDNKDELEEASKVGKKIAGSLGSPSIFAFAYYIFNEISRTDCKRFFNQLETGLMEYEYSPILKLRDALLANKKSPMKYKGRHIIKMVLHAWNLYRDRKTWRMLRLPSSIPTAK